MSAALAAVADRTVIEPSPAARFVLPSGLEASVPPEARGVTRDAVRMLVAYRGDGRLVHTTFGELPRFLDAGDLVVVNTSGTMAAALDGVAPDGDPVTVHLSTRLPAGLWTLELRRDDHTFTGGVAGDVVVIPESGQVELLAPYPLQENGDRRPTRLWLAALHLPRPLPAYLAVHGRPIQYRHVRGRWPLTAYQNVYATEPGSAEMPSAGRPFTSDLITRLVAKGVGVTPLLLHTGVASLETHEPPYPEQYRVPRVTADRVNDAHARGGRVVAIGTTVVRALETVADERGTVHPGKGWTDVIINPERGVRAVDGMLTGWHEPEASHLAMLEAVAGIELLTVSYEAALDAGYLWHEFGDVHLILP